MTAVREAPGAQAAPPAGRAGRWEPLAALMACALAALFLNHRILRPGFLSDDALVHLYWLDQVRDPALFTDPLTADLRTSGRYPDGYEALFSAAAHVFDPIAFGEWVGTGLLALSAWLVFLIVRRHTDWRAAAWIGAALFLAIVDIHRFPGGFPRAFIQPAVLLTVLLALQRRELTAALVAAAAALFYPPAALLAVGVLFVSGLRWRGGRPAAERRRIGFALLAAGLAAAAVLVPEAIDGGAPRVFTAAQARAYPEFGAHGGLHFFVASPLDYLRQNRSGFDSAPAGQHPVPARRSSLLLARPGQRAQVTAPRSGRCRSPSLLCFAAAQAVLFRLYLPHRYTYPLIPFFAIAVALLLRPTWDTIAARPRAVAFAAACAPLLVALAALTVFPLGPREPLAALDRPAVVAVALSGVVAAALYALGGRRRTAAAGAVLTGVVLVAVTLAGSDRLVRGTRCPAPPVVRHLATLPKDAIVAGDPGDLKCLPATAQRAVVISTQLAPAYEVGYFLRGRARMFADLRAVYGPSRAAIGALRTRYGATDLWIRRGQTASGKRWPAGGRRPYGPFVQGLLRQGEPASLRLPSSCLRFRRGGDEVYDIACVQRAGPA